MAWLIDEIMTSYPFHKARNTSRHCSVARALSSSVNCHLNCALNVKYKEPLAGALIPFTTLVHYTNNGHTLAFFRAITKAERAESKAESWANEFNSPKIICIGFDGNKIWILLLRHFPRTGYEYFDVLIKFDIKAPRTSYMIPNQMSAQIKLKGILENCFFQTG